MVVMNYETVTPPPPPRPHQIIPEPLLFWSNSDYESWGVPEPDNILLGQDEVINRSYLYQQTVNGKTKDLYGFNIKNSTYMQQAIQQLNGSTPDGHTFNTVFMRVKLRHGTDIIQTFIIPITKVEPGPLQPL